MGVAGSPSGGEQSLANTQPPVMVSTALQQQGGIPVVAIRVAQDVNAMHGCVLSRGTSADNSLVDGTDPKRARAGGSAPFS